MSHTLHTWVPDPQPRITNMFVAPELRAHVICRGCGASMTINKDLVEDTGLEGAAIIQAAGMQIPGTCEEFVVKSVMER